MLRIAERMLAENGGEVLKFADVFHAAGVSRGSAYRIYNGIEDLLQDLAGEWLGNFVSYLSVMEFEEPPPDWMALSDRIVERGARYWTDTAETLKVLPRIISSAPETYGAAVKSLSECLDRLFSRYFEMPPIPGWQQKLAFYTQLGDAVYADAMRLDGRVGQQRLVEAQTLCRTYLAFHLPSDLPPRSSSAVRGKAVVSAQPNGE